MGRKNLKKLETHPPPNESQICLNWPIRVLVFVWFGILRIIAGLMNRWKESRWVTYYVLCRRRPGACWGTFEAFALSTWGTDSYHRAPFCLNMHYWKLLTWLSFSYTACRLIRFNILNLTTRRLFKLASLYSRVRGFAPPGCTGCTFLWSLAMCWQLSTPFSLQVSPLDSLQSESVSCLFLKQ